VQSTCSLLRCHLWGVWLYSAFPHYLTRCTIFGKKLTENTTCVLIFSTTFSETFLILRRIQRDITTNAQSAHYSCQNFAILRTRPQKVQHLLTHYKLDRTTCRCKVTWFGGFRMIKSVFGNSSVVATGLKSGAYSTSLIPSGLFCDSAGMSTTLG